MFVDGKNTTQGQRKLYPASVQNSFRTTNYILQQSKPHRNPDISLFPEFKSIVERRQIGTTLRKSPPHRASHSVDNQQNPESLCTTFMKSYVQKLKKERKRQNKKMLISKTNKMRVEKDSLLAVSQNNRFDDGPLCKMNKPNQILILERVSHPGKMNTISVVSEDIYQKYESLDATRTSHRNRNNERSVELENREKIDRIIREIKNSRKKLSADQLNLGLEYIDISTMDADLFRQKFGFPKVPTSSRKRGYKISTVDKSNCERKKKKKQTEFNMNNLQPWNEEKKQNQYSIEEYDNNNF